MYVKMKRTDEESISGAAIGQLSFQVSAAGPGLAPPRRNMQPRMPRTLPQTRGSESGRGVMWGEEGSSLMEKLC